MAPSASILFPTRRRRDYLAVALASVAAQAREHGAEIVVVEDDPADAATALVAERHGARYVAHGHARGLNAARNTAIGAAAAELLCFLDDDVEAWPGWLAALLAGAAAEPAYDVYGGPIRARLEGSSLRSCGREPLPVTTLDLGARDTEADFVWGANMTLRRGALELAGGFDEQLDLYGDEEDWQRRLRAAGGRVRYLAAAGVDHRRAGADARVAGLARAAYGRGRNSRRYDVRKAAQPSLAAELRTVAGCVWHTARYRCGTGIVLTALSAGRLREAVVPAGSGATNAPGPVAPAGSGATTAPGPVAPAGSGATTAPGPVAPGDRDYLSGQSGTLGRRDLIRARARDAAADLRDARLCRALRRAALTAPPRRRVLVAGVTRPETERIAAAAAAELGRSRHAVEKRLGRGAPGRGKWGNLRATLADHPPDGADWLLLIDDDVLLPGGFLDSFLLAAERCGFALAQPAHAFASHAAWPVTRRRPGLLARRTAFVEIGPVTAIHASAFATLLPFPDLAMGWGLDAHWSAAAAAAGLALGIVDATPVRHLRPVATSYPHAAAVAEADAFLRDRPYVTRAAAAQTLASWRELP